MLFSIHMQELINSLMIKNLNVFGFKVLIPTFTASSFAEKLSS